MTGFAQVKGQVNGQFGFTLSLKSVNHRFLDIHFRMPSDSDDLEMKLRRRLKEKMARGHVELTLNVERNVSEGFSVNRTLVGGYIQAFRAAAAEFKLAADPDLNAILRIPGALESETLPAGDGLEAAVLAKMEEALARLNQMREEEGRGTERELRQRMGHVQQAREGVEKHRQAALHVYADRLKSRLQELIGSQIEPERILQEAALLVDRSDIQEELVRLGSACETSSRLAGSGRRSGEEVGFPFTRNESGGEYIVVEDFGIVGRSDENYRAGIVHES